MTNHPTPQQRAEAWAAEAEARPRIDAVLAEARCSTNPLVIKLIAQWDRGLLCSFEIEPRLREILTP